MKTKKPLTILSTNQLLQQIWDYIISRPGKKGEKKANENAYIYFVAKDKKSVEFIFPQKSLKN